MASSQPVAAPRPLSFMKKLSPVVSYFDPSENPETSPAAASSTTTSAPTSTSPELVVIFGWMGAREAPVAKYVAQHRALFPQARILLVQTPLENAVFEARGRAAIAPAVDVVAALAETSPASASASTATTTTEPTEQGRPASGKPRPRMLVHVFSNGGLFSFAAFLDRYRHGSPSASLASLPAYTTVVDSAPGFFHWARVHRAFAASLPGWASPLVHAVIPLLWLYLRVLGRDPLGENASAMDAPELLGHEARRSYVYSEADAMVDWRDVEAEADRASALGFDVRKEKFEGSAHVSHARTDGDRYWSIVRATWEGWL